MKQAGHDKQKKRRARRFRIEVPLCYRVVGDASWRFGTSANMSRSGLLFVGEHALDPRTPIEVSFQLPMPTPGEPGAQVMCRGEIARSAVVQRSEAAVTLAATIEAYRFVRIAGVE